jgi:hypothetical protein
MVNRPTTWGAAFKDLAKQPVFLVAAAVLLVAAVSLNAATQFMKLHFKKLPVPLAHTLEDIPLRLGDWVCVAREEISDDVEQELGTHLYVMRYYVKKSALLQDELEQFEGKTPKQSAQLLTELKAKHKGKLDASIISFAVTYYTGKADTVAHIPERCYTADGYEPVAAETETWDLKDKQTPDGNLNFRYISFEDQTGTTIVKRNVAYTFHVNGSYNSDPTRVRMALQNLFERYGYYAKVEVMVQEPERDAARKSMQDFLISALPEVEKCLPDWNAVTKAPGPNK